MPFLTDILLSFLHPFGVVLLAALAGFSGWFFPYLLLSWCEFRHPKVALLSGLFCLLLVAQFGEDLLQSKKRDAFIAQQVQELHQDKIFTALFTQFPESEATLRSFLAKEYTHLQAANEDEKPALLADIRLRLIQGYFVEFLGGMGNDDLYRYLTLSYSQIQALQKTPRLCVQYYLGMPAAEFSRLSEEWMDREDAIKYAVMVKSVRTPYLKEMQNREQIIAALVTAYRAIRQDESELEKSDALMELEPKEGCDIARHLLEAFLHMGPEMGARAYRFVMLEGNKYYRLSHDDE